MIRTLLRHLLVDFLILVALLTASAVLPVATPWLVRNPIGAQVVFWLSPWVVAVWSIILLVMVESRFWRGRQSVEEWKARQGCWVWRHAKSTMWMFSALLFSYAFEFAVVLLVPPSPLAMHLFPIATWSPVAFTILWSAARG